MYLAFYMLVSYFSTNSMNQTDLDIKNQTIAIFLQQQSGYQFIYES